MQREKKDWELAYREKFYQLEMQQHEQFYKEQ